MSKHSGLSRRAWLKTAAAIGATTACSSSVSRAASTAEENPKPSFIASAAQAPAEWKDRAPIQLKDLRVTLSEPVLVKRSRWYCWFPSLMRQPDGMLWAIMTKPADVTVFETAM